MKVTKRSGSTAATIVATSLLVATAFLVACAPSGTTTPGAAQSPAATPAPATVAPSPSPSPTPAASDSDDAPRTRRVTFRVYLGRGEHVQPVYRTAAYTKGVLGAAIRSLLAGPTAAEKAGGIGTVIPEGTALRGISVKGGVATIDLTSRYQSGGGTLSMTIRLAQVVYTATQFPGVSGVLFKLDGKRIKALGGEGIIVDTPQRRSDFESSAPPVLVEAPSWGQPVDDSAASIRIRGTSNVFEAVHNLEIVDRSGRVRARRRVMASSGTGTRGTWVATVPGRAFDHGPSRIRVFTLSPKDGSREDVLEIPVTLSAR